MSWGLFSHLPHVCTYLYFLAYKNTSVSTTKPQPPLSLKFQQPFRDGPHSHRESPTGALRGGGCGNHNLQAAGEEAQTSAWSVSSPCFRKLASGWRRSQSQESDGLCEEVRGDLSAEDGAEESHCRLVTRPG